MGRGFGHRPRDRGNRRATRLTDPLSRGHASPDFADAGIKLAKRDFLGMVLIKR